MVEVYLKSTIKTPSLSSISSMFLGLICDKFLRSILSLQVLHFQEPHLEYLVTVTLLYLCLRIHIMQKMNIRNTALVWLTMSCS